MALISKLKELIGGNGSGSTGGTRVEVEREPDPASERAVKEPTSEPEAPAEAEGAGEPVDSLSGIGAAYAERLADAGVETVADLAAADAADLAEATGIGEGRLAGWIEQADDR